MCDLQQSIVVKCLSSTHLPNTGSDKHGTRQPKQTSPQLGSVSAERAVHVKTLESHLCPICRDMAFAICPSTNAFFRTSILSVELSYFTCTNTVDTPSKEAVAPVPRTARLPRTQGRFLCKRGRRQAVYSPRRQRS